MVRADFPGDLAGTQPGQQSGKRLSELGAFARNLGADHDKKHDDQHEQQGINDGNCATPPLEQAVQIVNEGAHQVGKKDGEEEGDQSVAGDVKKSQHQREQQHRDQYPSRT